MAKRIPGFNGFTYPISSFVMLTDEFFKVLPLLTLGELRVFLLIYQKTWGWRKLFKPIPISEFQRELKLSKTSVLKALKSLEECLYILRFRTGTGGGQKTYFFVNSSPSRQVAQMLKDGHLDIEQAESMNRIYPRNEVKHEPNVDKLKSAENRPKSGQLSRPKSGQVGQPSTPVQRTKKKRGTKKENLSSQKGRDEIAESDSAQRLREQRLTQKRQQAKKPKEKNLLDRLAQKLRGQ